ncbi:hypothetical protein BLOT_015090 [Blomia tropicalis]|nr:hypothetical protein BLOT_015090 [Blomia tropicalis]
MLMILLSNIFLFINLIPWLMIYLRSSNKSNGSKCNSFLDLFQLLLFDHKQIDLLIERFIRLQRVIRNNSTTIHQELNNVSSKNILTRSTIEIYRPTLRIRVMENSSKRSEIVRALLDTGSEHSYISPQLVERIRLKTNQIWPISVRRFPGIPASVCYRSVSGIQLESIGTSKIHRVEQLQLLLDVEHSELARTCRSPSSALIEAIKNGFGIQLSDIESDSPCYDLLIGQDLLNGEILRYDNDDELQLKMIGSELTIWKTRFGSTVIGRFDKSKSYDNKPFHDTNIVSIRQQMIKVCSTRKEFSILAYLFVLLPSLIIFINLTTILSTIFILLCTIPVRFRKMEQYLWFLSFCLWIMDQNIELFFNGIKPFIYNRNKRSLLEQCSFQPLLSAKISDLNLKQTEQVTLLFDSGAIYSYISYDLIRKLDLQDEIITIGKRKAIRLLLSSNCNESYQRKILLWVHPNSIQSALFDHSTTYVSDYIKQNLDKNIEWNTNIPNNDHRLIIIGSDLMGSLLTKSIDEHVRLNRWLVATKTKFGWFLQGTSSERIFDSCSNANMMINKPSIGIVLTSLLFLWFDLLPFIVFESCY